MKRLIFALLAAAVCFAAGGQAKQDVSLREYVDLRFVETQRAIDKAEATMNERLAGMNEFRTTLKDQAATFIPRLEYDGAMERIKANVAALQKIADVSAGKASQGSMLLALAISVLGLLISGSKAVLEWTDKKRSWTTGSACDK